MKKIFNLFSVDFIN